jgi:signal transduction histidine kinase
MRNVASLPLFPYAVAVAAVGAALAAPVLAGPLVPSAFTLALAAVAVAGWSGGAGPGLLATALSALALDYLFLPPAGSLRVGPAGGVRLGVFVLAAVFLTALQAASRRREASLRRRYRRRGEFVTTLAHEMRNFLSPVGSALRVLRARGAEPAVVERSHALAERQVAHMARLIDDLLDLSRIDRGKLRLHRERADLVQVVAHAVEAARPGVEARAHRLEVSLPAGPVWLDADPTRLEQVLVNLLTNAARYTEPGGRVGVALERRKGEALVRVRDTGMGLPADLLPHLFDLFAQADGGRWGGLGVGLSLARGVARLHGGDLTASSGGPGTGSEFVLRLPVPEPAGRRGARSARPEGPRDVWAGAPL